jgi:hypothetical protein
MMNAPNRGEIRLVDIPHAKLVRKLGALTSQQMADSEDAVCDWLGL